MEKSPGGRTWPTNIRLSSCRWRAKADVFHAMSQLRIKLADERTAFSPGETIDGNVSWELDAMPQRAELQLIWNTQGKGTTDIEVVRTVPFHQPQASDIRHFTMQLPESPYTFSGQLISLIWNLELNIEPGDRSEAVEITIAPGGKEVLLPRIQPAP